MFRPVKRDSESASVTAFSAGGIVFLVAVLTHYEVLSYWFTGSDTLTLIEKSRMRTPSEALRVFTSPLMYGTNFSIIVALFYRPVASLSYALDFWLWGLDPFGYHLTDLSLHATTAVLTFAFVRRVADDTLIGLCAGCLFAVHPITAEVVPTPARRHDVLATVFVLCSLLLFLRAIRVDRSRVRRWLLVFGSVFTYLLAVGAKEVGMIAPPLIGAWFLLIAYDRGYSVSNTLWQGFAIVVPYTIATIVYLWWRIRVLGGLGGYKDGPWKTSNPLLETLSKYVLSLLYPVDIVQWLFKYDLQLVPYSFYVFLVGTLLLFAYALSRVEEYDKLLRSNRGRLAAISVAWLVVLGVVFVWFGRYSIRSGYVALVPTAAVLSLIVVTTGRKLVGEVHGADRRNADIRTVVIFALTTALVCSLLWVSPLVYPYDDWEHASRVASEALPAAANAYESSGPPPQAVIAIAGIPQRPGSPGVVARRPHARTIAYFYANTVASWIRMTHPDSKVATHVGGRLVSIGEEPLNVNATISQTVDRRHYRMEFRYPPENRSIKPDRSPREYH